MKVWEKLGEIFDNGYLLGVDEFMDMINLYILAQMVLDLE